MIDKNKLKKMIFCLMRIKRIFFIFIILFGFNVNNIVYAVPYYPQNKNIEEYLQEKSNDIQQNINNWKSLLDDSKIRYLNSIVKFFLLETPPSTRYPNTKRKIEVIDRGDLLLGLYTYNDEHWVINDSAGYGNYDTYKSIVNTILSKISNAKLTYVNSNLRNMAKEYMVKYYTGVTAGLSGAWNPRPDAKLQHRLMDSEGSLKYAFRINQQGLRHVVLRHYIDELYEQKKEVAGFINFVKDLCNRQSQIFSSDIIQSVGRVTATPDIIRSIRCPGTLTYNRIIESVSNLTRFLFEMNQRELTVMCTQATILAWQNNLLSTTNELRLYQLSAFYNLLQHFEK